jgi:eukaryotic-like serine/threonine-protein kinase
MRPEAGGSSDLGTTPPVAQPAGAFMPPKIGATLGRYQILATLGHGAMATVFRARDPQLGRDVALKVMGMMHAARGGATERFRREAHAVAALKHPGIVEIYDFVDATETEPSYMVAELIEGPTLRKLVETAGGRLLPEFAALIALPLVEALAIAHERGVIHRDVKPDNVMVETSGKGSRVVLTDFGVAHITGMETMTATGAMVGSPAYMSPEQSRGQDVGPATDLWSLGAMLYEMVTGTVPFPGKDPYTVIAAILRGSFRPPAQVVATVAPEFEAMIMRCLKPRPTDRYASAAALAEALRAFTRAAGLVPDGEALRRYLDDPEAAIADLRPRVAEAATARARTYARRGQLARALAEIGHATAYVPDHPGANRLLRRLSAGRKVIRIVVAATALAAAVGIIWLLLPWLRAKSELPPSAAPATATRSVTTAVSPSAPPVAAPPAATAIPPVQTATEPTTTKTKAKSRGGRRSKSLASTETAATAENIQAAAAIPAPAASPAPEPVPAPVREAVAPRPGTIALFAKGGFCYPSLDDHLPSDLMPVYREVTPGKHKVFCSRTKGSPKEFAGEVDLPSGGHIERTVTEQGGRLTLARPR